MQDMKTTMGEQNQEQQTETSAMPEIPHPAHQPGNDAGHDVSFDIKNLNLHYGNYHALKDLNIKLFKNHITALIGPSGCGKSSLLRTLNRMNDFVHEAKLEGEVILDGENIYGPKVDPVEIRLRVGMVFQNPNPFPKTIYENIALGPRINGYTGDIDELVESSLRSSYLWDEVKDKLEKSAYSLSGGQQQRLCIARAIAMLPEVLLMDEPTASLDPISTRKIEELIQELKETYTIIIVTHNMQQAARIGDYTALFYQGWIVEYDKTFQIFTNPGQKLTEDYITGRFG